MGFRIFKWDFFKEKPKYLNGIPFKYILLKFIFYKYKAILTLYLNVHSSLNTQIFMTRSI